MCHITDFTFESKFKCYLNVTDVEIMVLINNLVKSSF